MALLLRSPATSSPTSSGAGPIPRSPHTLRSRPARPEPVLLYKARAQARALYNRTGGGKQGGMSPISNPVPTVQAGAMSPFDRQLLRNLAERQHGALALDQAKELGMSRSARYRLGTSSDFTSVSNRVVRLIGAPRTVEQRLMVAVLDVGGDAALSHLTGAKRWGLDGCSLTPISLVTTKGGPRRTDLAETHVVRSLPPNWRCVLDGIPIVRPELLALQLFAVCRFERAETLVDRLWSRRLLSGPSIVAFLAQMGERGRNGTAGLRRYIDDRGDDYVPPASGLEGRVRRLLDDAGVEMDRQVDSGGSDWTGRVDFRAPDLPLVLEVQSEAHHEALVDKRRDDARRRQLLVDGFVVCEVTDEQVWERPWEVVAEVRLGLAEARALRNPST